MGTRELRHGFERVVNAAGLLARRLVRRPAIPANVARITTLHLDRIGDTFVSTPALAALAERFPGARITAVVAPWNRSVLEGNHAVSEIVVVEPPDVHSASFWSYLSPGKVSSLADVLRVTNPEVLVDFQMSPLTAFAGVLARVPVRSGDAKKFLSFLLTHPSPHVKDMHQIDVCLSAVRVLGWSGDAKLPQMFPGDGERAAVQQFLSAHGLERFVVFHLSAGRTFRRWPVQHFAAVAAAILRDHPAMKIVVDGGPDDGLLAATFANLLSGDLRVVLATGQFSMRASYELYSHASGFVGNDSAPGHVAASLCIPTATTMNAWTEVERWRARGPAAQAFYVTNSAHRCLGNACDLDPCPRMQELSPDLIYAWIGPKLAA